MKVFNAHQGCVILIKKAVIYIFLISHFNMYFIPEMQSWIFSSHYFTTFYQCLASCAETMIHFFQYFLINRKRNHFNILKKILLPNFWTVVYVDGTTKWRNKGLMLARKPLVIWQHGGTYAGLMSFAPVGSVMFFLATLLPLTALEKD